MTARASARCAERQWRRNRRSRRRPAPAEGRRPRPPAKASATPACRRGCAPQPAASGDGCAAAKRASVSWPRPSPSASRSKGVDLLALKGSGPHGRIIKADVEKAPKGAAAKQAPAAGGGITSLIEPAVLDDRVYAPDSYELIPLDGVRKVTARRLTQSFMQVPHFPLTIDLEIDHLLSARVRDQRGGARQRA